MLVCKVILIMWLAIDVLVTADNATRENAVTEELTASRGHMKGNLMSMVKMFAPLLAVPMTLQALAVPFQLGAVYLMLFYSVLIGKLALTLMVANQIRRNKENMSPQYEQVMHHHYGYDGSEEYGAWIN